MSELRVISLIAAYNEELYIAAVLEHLRAHGVSAYLIDNESTDRTVEIARQYLGRGLVGIETMSRRGVHILGEKLKRKEQLALELDGDWFIHQDADEFRLPPQSGETLAQALARVDAAGYNAVQFDEFVFIPTREEPNHEHEHFQQTMRGYYSFRPRPLHRLNAWKKQPTPVDLYSHGGHCVLFSGQKLYPENFKMRHYHFLSVPHAIRKLVGRPYVQEELDKGWHNWRPRVRAEMLSELPSSSELESFLNDDALVLKQPRVIHYIGELVERAQAPLSKPAPTPSKQERARVIALLSAYNEELYIAACLEHLIAQGAQAYLIDNESTDRTVEIAQRYLGRGLVGIESFPRNGMFRYRELLERKQALAQELDADWFIQHDVDEFRVSARTGETLADAFARVTAEGYNAVQFDEYVFIPTREAPDHAHPNFLGTMRHYYPLRPRPLHRLNAWQKQPTPVNFADSSGHRVFFADLKLSPESFKMRHYHFLSAPHALERYTGRVYAPAEVAGGWHSWRPHLSADMPLELPSQHELTLYTSDAALVMKNPRDKNYLGELVERARAARTAASCGPGDTTIAPRAESKAAHIPHTGPQDSIPPALFIVGVGRSGTSLLRSMCNAHPELAVPPETGIHYHGYRAALSEADSRAAFLRYLRAHRRAPLWDVDLAALELRLGQLDPFTLAEGVRAFYLLYASQNGKVRWGDKTPTNLKYMSVIQTVLPEARFVHIIRDGRAVALSRQEMPWALPSLAQEALFWELNVNTARTLGPRLKHYLEIRYEELVREPEPVLRRICALLDLPFHPRMLEYDQVTAENTESLTLKPRSTAKSRVPLTRRPPDPSRIARWRRKLTRSQIRELEDLIGETLRELGYEAVTR